MAPAHSDRVAPRTGERAPWGTINREQIIRAALGVVRSGGYEQMTIRSLAAGLGVSPMTLYQHVRAKDDLLDEVVDRLLARAWKPKTDPDDDWRAWITGAAGKLRHLLVTQPAALHVYLTHPVVSPAAIARMDSFMTVLTRALGQEQRAEQAYAAIHTYTIGFAALEASRSRWQPPLMQRSKTDSSAAGDPQPHDPPLSDDADLVRRLAAFTTPDQFSHGLHYLLDGLERDGPGR